MQRGRIRPAVERGDLDEDVFHIRFRVFHEDVEIPVVLEHARIQQLKLRIRAPALSVFLHQPAVRKFRLRVLVQHAHVAVSWRGIQVEITLFHVLAMISLIAGQTEKAFLQDGIFAVPQGQRETDHLVPVANSTNPVFAPAIGPRVGVFERKVFPGRPVGAVVFADGSPLPVGKIRPPALPMLLALPGFFQTMIFNSKESGHG